MARARATASPAPVAQNIALRMVDPSFSQLPPLIKAFEQANPTVTVTRQVTNDYPSTIQAVQTAIAAGQPPDLAWIGYSDLRFAAANLPHQTITQAAQADAAGGGVRYLADNFAPNVLALGQVDGVQHGLPFGLSDPVFWYNADLLTQAGLARAPRTWDEVRDSARRLTRKTGVPGLQIASSDFWQYQAIIESNGARVLIKSGSGYRTGIDSPQAIAAMQVLADMAARDKSVQEAVYAQVGQTFAAGRTGLLLASSAFEPSYAQAAKGKFTLGCVPLPTFGAKPRRVPAGAGNLMIFATDPARQAAAYRFIQYLNTPAALTQWCQLITVFPTRKGVAADPRYLAPFYDRTPLLKPGLAQIPDAVPFVSWPGHSGPQASQIFFDACNKIVGGAAAAATLKDAAARINQLIGA